MFPYRRHGPKKRIKHGPNRKARGPQKGLPNSARDLLPLLQPATKALAQVLAGRAGASGQLGHARSMLSQAERLIAERAHNRLTPAEREEFFEQLARLKLTIADAEAEAEVQAVEQQEPRPQAAPVARERLKEMALALTVRERTSQPAIEAESAGAKPGDTEPEDDREPREEEARTAEPAREPPSGAAGRAGRLMLPRASADKAVQALAIGSLSRRRNRTMSWADAASAADASGRALTAPDFAEVEDRPAEVASSPEPETVPAAGEPPHGVQEAEASEASRGGNGAAADAQASPAKPVRRRRKPTKQQGLPDGWVIDEEGFVVPGAS